MSFAKAAQHTNSEALVEFSFASVTYKKACQEITVKRLSLDRPDATDTEIAMYHRAKKAYSQACKVYNAARAKYIGSVRAAAMRLPSPSNDELFSISLETNDRAIGAQLKHEAIVASFTPEEWEMGRKFAAERAAKFSTKQDFLSAEARVIVNDPTFEEFSDLPEPKAPPGIEVEATDADVNLEFDPKFDKL